MLHEQFHLEMWHVVKSANNDRIPVIDRLMIV